MREPEPAAGAGRRSCPLAVAVAIAIGLGLAPARGVSRQSFYPTPDAYRTALGARFAHVREVMSRQTWTPGEDGRKRVYLGVVKVATGHDAETGLRYLRDAVHASVPAWGSFETYAFMDAVLRLGKKLPADLVGAIRDRLAASFTTDFGFTDNHRLQYRTARYLFGQTWPAGPTLADGMSPARARQEAGEWIARWISDTTSRGMYEYDSPNYHHLYLLCFATLHEYVEDARLRQQAWMMEHVLLADWATEYLSGIWVGAHSREKYNQVTHTTVHPGAATEFGPLFFGNAPFHLDLPEAFYVSLAALQAFEPLPIIGHIATDRSRPYVLRELKPPRRGPGIVNGEPTWKYTYVTPGFALGSSWGDLTDVENHRWDLSWISRKDGSTCFFINPSYSARQLVRYYETTIDAILAEIVRQRPYYADPHKWIEGSPHEDVFQHENVVVAIYDIPRDEARQYVNGFFPHAIAERAVQAPWILCRGDGVYFAVWTATPGEWHPGEDHDRLTLRAPRTAVVLEAVPATEYPSFEAFSARVRRATPVFDRASLTATLTSTRGHTLRFTHRGRRVVDGKDVHLADWPLFEGPWMSAKPGSRVITLRHDRERVVLDFNSNTVTTSR